MKKVEQVNVLSDWNLKLTGWNDENAKLNLVVVFSNKLSDRIKKSYLANRCSMSIGILLENEKKIITGDI